MMNKNQYLQWLSENTNTSWWHDSAVLNELAGGMTNGAVGVTTNPLLVKQSLYSPGNPWLAQLTSVPKSLTKDEKAEEIIRRITVRIAEMFEPIYKQTQGGQGYVCAQVSPRFQGDRQRMMEMAKRLHQWAPNIAVKLPVTAAGLDALEECAAEGITVTATVSFTVAQALAIAERYRKGLQRAKANGIKQGKCFAVIMVGRIDDYLKDVAHDGNFVGEDSDLALVGTAIVKRTYRIFKEKNYEATLMPSGLRTTNHVTALAGGEMILSVSTKVQNLLAELSGPFEKQIDKEVDANVIKRLNTIPEFLRAYEPDGMTPSEFISFGSVQRTLSQFTDAGWANIEDYPL
jgi:transaldolase